MPGPIPKTTRKSLQVVSRQINDLRPYANNARNHGKKQIAKLAASIRQFGFTNPILVDADGRVLAGHGRLTAAREVGMTEVPTICLDHLSDAEKRAYLLADNRLAELAGWDRELLVEELTELSKIDLGFDIDLTGFETGEIDLMIDGAAAPAKTDRADQVVTVDDGPAVSRVGDLWLLGSHRLLCADALKPGSYERLLDGERAQVVFTDPPYNVRIRGNVGGLGQVQHGEFVMASGEMSEAEFTAFLTSVLSNLARFSQDGAIHFVCIDWRHLLEVTTAGRSAYASLKNVCIWAKDNGGMGSFYRAQHEFVFVFKNGTAPHINNFGLGEKGRYRTNLWSYAGVNTFRPGRHDELGMHPTVKPVALVADAIRDCSKRGGIVLDAFSGSGTTLIAAERTGRAGAALELDPKYVDVAVRRWQRFTGKNAKLAGLGETFEAVSSSRSMQRADGKADPAAEKAARPASAEAPRRRRARRPSSSVRS
jgi:DNA modification methylase